MYQIKPGLTRPTFSHLSWTLFFSVGYPWLGVVAMGSLCTDFFWGKFKRSLEFQNRAVPSYGEMKVSWKIFLNGYRDSFIIWGSSKALIPSQLVYWILILNDRTLIGKSVSSNNILLIVKMSKWNTSNCESMLRFPKSSRNTVWAPFQILVSINFLAL